jgi:structural maintenance of chromosome 2
MVEEAAGTKMYEVKKIAALKTIAKKEIKVQEINSVLREEITPTLERLRGEKHNYLAWNQNEVQLQRLERFVIAHDYYQAETIVQETEQTVETMETQLADYQNQACTFHQEVESKQEEMNVLSSQLQNDVGQDHVKAKALEERLAKELVKATSAWSNSEANAKKAIQDSKVAQDLVLETKQAIQVKQSQMEGDAKEISLIHEEAHAAQEELTRLTTEYQSMCAGISSEESGGNSDSMTLPNQISKAHTDANGADAKAKQATMKILHLSKSIKVSNSKLCLYASHSIFPTATQSNRFLDMSSSSHI